MPLRTHEQLAEVAGRAAETGIASEIHAIGDGAVRTVLDVIEALPSVSAAMHRVEHAQLIDPADIARFGALGIPASVQPSHLLSDAAAMRTSWGARSADGLPAGDARRRRAMLPFGTDAPVESPNPWPGLAAAVTRRGPGWTAHDAFHPEQAIGLDRALRGACLDGPRSARVSDQGHLDDGARADLLVVPAALSRRPSRSRWCWPTLARMATAARRRSRATAPPTSSSSCRQARSSSRPSPCSLDRDTPAPRPAARAQPAPSAARSDGPAARSPRPPRSMTRSRSPARPGTPHRARSSR